MSAAPSTLAAASGADLLLWVAIPYICLAVFAVGHVCVISSGPAVLV